MDNKEPNYKQLAEELLLPWNPETGKVENPTVAGYQNILEHGLGGTINSDKKVVIVGAGIAGMLSALLLADYGLKVTIIEANDNRVGGRVKTFGDTGDDSPFSDGQYAEAGAMRFPNFHPLLMQYIKKFGLEDKKQEFFNVSVKDPNLQPNTAENKINTSFLRTNSFQTRKSDYAKHPKVINQGFFPDSAAPEKEAGDLLDAALDVARDYYSYEDVDADGNKVRYDKDNREDWINGWAKLIEDFDRYTLGGFLTEVAGLHKNEIELIGTLTNLTARMPLSFIHSFLGRSDINPGNTYYELQGGSWQLTEVLRELIDKNYNIELKMNHRMTHIHFYKEGYNSDEFGFEYYASDNPGERISIRAVNEEEVGLAPVKGDLAIITIPFSSLRFVRTLPDFSYGKRRAIIELHYDAATKVLLEFDKRWWEWDDEQWTKELGLLRKSGKINEMQYNAYKAELVPLQKGRPAMHAHGGGSATDNPNRAMYYPSHVVEVSNDKSLPGGVVLASYTWSDDARRWDSMDDEARYDFALRGMANIHGEKIRPFCTGKLKVDGPWARYTASKGASKGQVKGAATQSWARSPYAFGEAAVFQAYQFTNLHPNIPTIEGPVHFAGEHTSLKHAWLEGSLESAIRAAKEIKAAVK